MSKRNPTFSPRHYTIRDLEKKGIRIHSVDQHNNWAVIKTEGEFHTMKPGKSPYNQWGDHIAIRSVTIKIRMT